MLHIRRIDKVLNARIRKLYGVMKGLDLSIDEVVLWWFGNMERIENDRIANRVYVGKCPGSRSVGRHGRDKLIL